MIAEDIRYVRCQRCNLSLRVRVQPGNPEAGLICHPSSGEELCVSCAVTLFLRSVPHIKHRIDEKRELLLWDVMQTQFARLMELGNADARPSEVDWQHVCDCWDLPFATKKRGKREKRG